MTIAVDFWRTWYRYSRQTIALQKRTFNNLSMLCDLRLVLTVAPVVENKGYFELYDGPTPPKSFWRWLIAVRSGLTGDPLFDGDLPDKHQREALCGFYVDDIVACSQDLKHVTSRMIGVAPVVGWPQDPLLAAEPVRIRENPLAWLLARGDGVFLCGRDNEVQDWLRGCDRGVVVGSVPMGEAVEKKMKRAGVSRPRILVDA